MMEDHAVQGLLWKCKKGVTGSSWKKNWAFCDGIQFSQYGGNMRPDKNEEPKYSMELVECTIKENDCREYSFEIVDNFTKKSMVFAASDANQFQKWWSILINPVVVDNAPPSPHASPTRKNTIANMLLSPFFKSTNTSPGLASEGDDFYEEEYEEAESEDLTTVSKYAALIRKYFQQQENHPVPFHTLHSLVCALDPFLIPSRVLHFIAQQLQYPSLDSLVTFEEFVTIWMLFEHIFIPPTKEQCFEYYVYPSPGTPHPNTTTFYGRTSHSNISYVCPMMFRIHIPTTLLPGYATSSAVNDSVSGYHTFQGMEELIHSTSTKILQQLTSTVSAGHGSGKSHGTKKPYDWYGIYSSYIIQVQKHSVNYHHYMQSTKKIIDPSMMQPATNDHSTVNGSHVDDHQSQEEYHHYHQQIQKEKLIALFQYNHQERFEKQQAFDEVLYQTSTAIMTLWHSFHIMAMQGCELFIQEYTLPNHLKSMIPISLSLNDPTNPIALGLSGLREERGIGKGILASTSGSGIPLSTAPNNTPSSTNATPQLTATNRIEVMSHLYLQERIFEYHGIYLYSYTLHLVDPAKSSDANSNTSSTGTTRDGNNNNGNSASSMSWNSSNMSMFQRMYTKANEIYQKLYLTEWKNYLVLQREYDHVWMEDLLVTRYCPYLLPTDVGKEKETATYTADPEYDNVEDEDDDYDEEDEEEEDGEYQERSRRRKNGKGAGAGPLRGILRPVPTETAGTNRDRSYSPTRGGNTTGGIHDPQGKTPPPPNGYQDACMDEMLLRRRFITMIDYSGYRMIAYVPTPSNAKVTTPVTAETDFGGEHNPVKTAQHQTVQEVMQRIIHQLQERLFTLNPISFSSFLTPVTNPFAVEEPPMPSVGINYDGILPTPVNALSTGLTNGPPVPKKLSGYYINHAHVLSPDLFPVHTPDILIKQLRKELVFSFGRYASSHASSGHNNTLTSESDEDSDEDEYEEEEEEDEEAHQEWTHSQRFRKQQLKRLQQSKFVNIQQFLQNEESQTAVNHAHYSGGGGTNNKKSDGQDPAFGAMNSMEITKETITPWITLCHHLYTNIIPTFLHHLDHYLHINTTSSLTSVATATPYGLSALMHRYGLNVHHLGILYSLSTNVFHKQFFLTEMVCRSMKVIYQMLITNYLETMQQEARLAILRKKSSLLQFQEFNQLINEYRQEIILLVMNYFFPASQLYSATPSTAAGGGAESAHNNANTSAKKREAQETNIQRMKVFLQQEEFANMLIDIIYNKFGVMLTNPHSVKHDAEPSNHHRGGSGLGGDEYDDDMKEDRFGYFGESRDPNHPILFDDEEEEGAGDGKEFQDTTRKPKKSTINSKKSSHGKAAATASNSLPSSMLFSSHWLDHFELHPMQFFHSLQYHLSCQFKEIVYTTKIHPKKFQNPSNIPFLPSDMIHFFLPVVHTQQSDEEEMGYWDIALSSIHTRNTAGSVSPASPTPGKGNNTSSSHTGRTGGGSGHGTPYQPHTGISTSLPEWLLSSGLTNHPLRSTVTFSPLPDSPMGQTVAPHWSKLGELGHQIGLIGYGSNIDYFFGLTYLSSFLHQNMYDEVYILLRSYYYMKVPLYFHLLSTITPTPSMQTTPAASTTTAGTANTTTGGRKTNTGNTNTTTSLGGKNVTSTADKTYLPKLPWQQVYAFAQITYTYLTICFQCHRYEECSRVLQYYLSHPYTQYHSFLPTSAILTLSLHYYHHLGTTIPIYPNGIPTGKPISFRRDSTTWGHILTTYNLLDQLYFSSVYSYLPSKHVGNTTAMLSLISFYEAHATRESYLQAKVLLLLCKSCWETCLYPSNHQLTSPLMMMKTHPVSSSSNGNNSSSSSSTVYPNRYSGVSYMIAYLCYRLGNLSLRLQQSPSDDTTTMALAYYQQAYTHYYQFTSPQSTFSAATTTTTSTSMQQQHQQHQHAEDHTSVSGASGRSGSRGEGVTFSAKKIPKKEETKNPLGIDTTTTSISFQGQGGSPTSRRSTHPTATAIGPLYPMTLVGRGIEPPPAHTTTTTPTSAIPPPHMITSTPLYPALTATSAVGKYLFSMTLSRHSTPLYYDAMCILYNIAYLQYTQQHTLTTAISTLTQLLQYYTHYAQFQQQVSLFQQYYTSTTIQLITGNNPALYKFHVKKNFKPHPGKEESTTGIGGGESAAIPVILPGSTVTEDMIVRKVKVILSEEMKELLLSSYLLLLECYERNQDYDFAMETIQSLLWFLHLLILSFTPLPRTPWSMSVSTTSAWAVPSLYPIGVDYPTLFSTLNQPKEDSKNTQKSHKTSQSQQKSTQTLSQQCIDTPLLLPLYATLNHKLLNNLILTYSHSTRHLLASIAQEYTLLHYTAQLSLFQQQSLVQLQYIPYEECILLTVNYFLEIWWNHWLVEYMEGLIRRVVEVEQRFVDSEEAAEEDGIGHGNSHGNSHGNGNSHGGNGNGEYEDGNGGNGNGTNGNTGNGGNGTGEYEEEYFYGDFIDEDDEEEDEVDEEVDEGEEGEGHHPSQSQGQHYGSAAVQRRKRQQQTEMEAAGGAGKNYVVKNRPTDEKPKLITRCYLCDDRLVEDYLVTKPPAPKATTHLLLQSLATQSTTTTRLQRILGRRRRNATTMTTVTSTLLQTSRMSREEMKELRRCLPLYAQVYVVYLLLQEPTQFAYYVSQLYSLPPTHYEQPQFT